MNRRAVFLDRDGTVITDLGYLGDPERVELLPGAGAALAALRREGFLLVLVSTQSGVGRGRIDAEAVQRVHDRMLELLRPYGVTFDDTRYCLHAPWDGCPCRKPSPLMLVEAALRLEVDTAASFMVGDKPEDIEAGLRAGCRTILIARASDPGPPHRSGGAVPDLVSADWGGILRHITETWSNGRKGPAA
jgi:D-glycero-D-manno-heptose 1,7-bisphosphate phosphatase